MAVPNAFRNGALAVGGRLVTILGRARADWENFMRRMVFVSLAVAIALTGCGGGADADGDGEISQEEVAAEAAGAIAPRPGQYETKVKLLEVNMPQAPGVDAGQMQAMMESSMNSTTTQCVTAEDAQNATKQMLEGGESENCTYSKFDVAGGNIEAEMTCTGPNGASSTMQLTGQMGREQSSLQMSLDQGMPGMPGGNAHFKMQVDSRRIGDCT